MNSKKEYPIAVVFDLDYTLWPFWCDTHISMPIKRKSGQKLVDRYGTEISFYKDVPSIVEELNANNVTIIGASRTATPRVAQEILSLLAINGKPGIKYFDSLQWGQGSKIGHIRKAAKDLGLQEDLEKGNFILFDDELRNKDVRTIGCEFAFIEDDRKGLTRDIFEKALTSWRQQNSSGKI